MVDIAAIGAIDVSCTGEFIFDWLGVDVGVVNVTDESRRAVGDWISIGLVGIKGVDTGVVGESGGSFSISG